METGDRDLLEACRGGSPGARDRFARRFGGLVHWAVRKTLGESPSARVEIADVFQDAFRKMFEPGALDAVRDAEALKSWIVVVACRAALDAGRRGSRRRGHEIPLETTIGEGLAVEDRPDPADGPAQRALDAEKSRLVREVLDTLPPRERACVRFHYLEGWTHARIGELLGLSENTVATIIRRCRDGLRKALEKRGYEHF